MKQWEDARNRVNELKETDPKGAEKMNQEISSRYLLCSEKPSNSLAAVI